MSNIFDEAKQILERKDAGGDISLEDVEKIERATMPLDFLPDMPIGMGLECLSAIVEPPPEPPRSKIWVIDLKADGKLPLQSVIRIKGRIAQLITGPRKAYKCHECGLIIEVKEPHYLVFNPAWPRNGHNPRRGRRCDRRWRPR